MQGGYFANSGMLAQIKSSDRWSEFQAKSTKRHNVRCMIIISIDYFYKFKVLEKLTHLIFCKKRAITLPELSNQDSVFITFAQYYFC
ncbi:hypothetical protein CDG79_29955 [Nostoc sp. 'Peltigera membranacea cyanobiont' 232]|nr:hypothetical protein CDG79_29955 [Nostoc sp. 'Peltigera membranacea cyanobiont' 232]